MTKEFEFINIIKSSLDDSSYIGDDCANQYCKNNFKTQALSWTFHRSLLQNIITQLLNIRQINYC